MDLKGGFFFLSEYFLKYLLTMEFNQFIRHRFSVKQKGVFS